MLYLKHYCSGLQLVGMIARYSDVDVNPAHFGDMLEVKTLHIINPDYRADSQLAFPVTQRIAPREIRRWMIDGSILS